MGWSDLMVDDRLISVDFMASSGVIATLKCYSIRFWSPSNPMSAWYHKSLSNHFFTYILRECYLYLLVCVSFKNARRNVCKLVFVLRVLVWFCRPVWWFRAWDLRSTDRIRNCAQTCRAVCDRFFSAIWERFLIPNYLSLQPSGRCWCPVYFLPKDCFLSPIFFFLYFQSFFSFCSAQVHDCGGPFAFLSEP